VRVPGSVIAGIVAVGVAGCGAPPSEEPPDEPQPDHVALPAGGEARIDLGDDVVCWDPEEPGPLLSFTESAEALGLHFTPSTPSMDAMPEGTASLDIELIGGLAVDDLDGDGDLDLLFSDGDGPLRYFAGDGPLEFREVPAAELGLDLHDRLIHGISLADIDADGDLDVYLLAREENLLLRNDGGTFIDVTDQVGLGGSMRRSVSAAWADQDGDGDLDVFVANHGSGAVEQNQFYPTDLDRFWVQQADGTFEDQIGRVYGSDRDGYGFAVAWFDADLDWDLDLYVGNDMANEGDEIPNAFCENLGLDGEPPWGLEPRPDAGLDMHLLSMGLVVGDMDNDLDLDVFVTQAGPPLLARNEGDLLFTDISLVVRGLGFTDNADISYSPTFFDHDNDGWQELHTTFAQMPTKGTGYGPAGTANSPDQPDGMWLWDADLETYQDIAPHLGIDDGAMNHASVAADLDRNGFLDLVIWGIYEGPKVWLSGCNTNSWLEVALAMPGTGNTRAVGARVELWDDDGPLQLRTVQAGPAGNFSTAPQEVHFGTGELDVAHLVVRWPDGTTTVNRDVPTRRRVWLTLD